MAQQTFSLSPNSWGTAEQLKIGTTTTETTAKARAAAAQSVSKPEPESLPDRKQKKTGRQTDTGFGRALVVLGLNFSCIRQYQSVVERKREYAVCTVTTAATD